MKSTLDRLAPKQKTALVNFYGTDAYEALKQLCKYEVEGLGKDALGSTSHEQTKLYSGQAMMAVKLPKIIKQLYEESKKNEALTKKG
ncbi:hypothetical protein UFOVP1522_49 [uncultured Caudovirales phage]|uniref:Uncharacterized protein n=1 Tax=uncultured Caudovirales phage TaxID=2100421 RepID=A0A6J5Q4K4_9CAUD|nr:hypothetical protein UFOVP989_38 [uncultured Caudovirales phage]CAB4181309.1 hypothetical protein UFOVP1075_28 [uncultured Caudovirales phage]CAB4198729.1 hypothetical protein UFOVP1312_20 [uncultured Caudovirales phage]CAB4210748.1 hypothetical protein UFOVP1426_38 [uncultured Caudovirales phage]CAB5227523.1 hypothetical protein UFOVP1522_49 [uncultured Caudovirales phage]